MTDKEFSAHYYKHVLRNAVGGPNRPRWREVRVDKFPQDLILYAQVIFKRKPDYIIETGTQLGGSALFFADMVMLCGGRKVFTIDTVYRDRQPHPLLEYVTGSSTDPEVVEGIKKQIKGSVMVSLDSSHQRHHVTREMELYAPIVTKGQYMVVEDSYIRGWRPYDPFISVNRFLKVHKEFRLYDLEKQFLFSVTKGGWLRKIR